MTPQTRRTALIFLAIVNGYGLVDRIVIALVAQDLKAAFLLSDLEVGLLGGTAFALVNAVVSIPVARIAERKSRAMVTAVSLAIASACTALCAAAASFAHLLAYRLGMAAGSAGTEAPPHSMISDMYGPEHRASAISLFMLGVPVAVVVGSYAGGAIAEAWGWRATFLVFGFTGLAFSLTAMFLLPEPKRGADAEHAPDAASLSKVVVTLAQRPHFLLVMFGASLVSLGSFGINTFLPSYLARNFALGTGDAGLVFGVIAGVASATGTLIGGYGSERLARRHPAWLVGFPGLGMLIGAPLFLFGVTRPSLELAAPIILMGSIFFYTVMGPVITVTHGLLDSRSRATGSAVFLLVVHLVGQGLGPPLAGFVSDTFAELAYGSADYLTACAGAAGQEPGSLCAAASAAGVRASIASFAFVYVVSGLSFLLAARIGFGRVRQGATEPSIDTEPL